MSRITSRHADGLVHGQAQAASRGPAAAPATQVDDSTDLPSVPVAARMRMIVLLALGLWAIIGGVLFALLT